MHYFYFVNKRSINDVRFPYSKKKYVQILIGPESGSHAGLCEL